MLSSLGKEVNIYRLSLTYDDGSTYSFQRYGGAKMMCMMSYMRQSALYDKTGFALMILPSCELL